MLFLYIIYVLYTYKYLLKKINKQNEKVADYYIFWFYFKFLK